MVDVNPKDWVSSVVCAQLVQRCKSVEWLSCGRGGGGGSDTEASPPSCGMYNIIKSIVLVSEIIKQTPHQFLLILRGVGWGSH